MKTIILCLLTFMVPVLLYSQNEDWFQKGVNAKDPGEQIKCYTKHIEQVGPEKEAYFNRGIAKFGSKEYESAISDFTRTIELDPHFYEAYFIRGLAKHTIFDFEGAKSDYSAALRINPNFAKASTSLKNVEGELKRNNTELSHFYVSMGNDKYKIQDYNGAVQYYSQAIERDPENITAYENRAKAKYALKDYKGSELDKSIASDVRRTKAIYYERSATTAMHEKDYEGAISDYSKAIKIYPEGDLNYLNRGIAKANIQDYQGAISDYLKAIECDSTSSFAYKNLALIYAKQKNIDAAIEISEKALKTINDPGILDNLGYFYMEKENYDKAIEKFNSNLNIIFGNDNRLDAMLGISLSYYYMNEKRIAKKYFEQAKEYKPCLNKGMEGLYEFMKEGYTYSDKDIATLKIMFEKFK